MTSPCCWAEPTTPSHGRSPAVGLAISLGLAQRFAVAHARSLDAAAVERDIHLAHERRLDRLPGGLVDATGHRAMDCRLADLRGSVRRPRLRPDAQGPLVHRPRVAG